VPKVLGAEEDVLEKEVLQHYIMLELRNVGIGLQLITPKYGASICEELDEKIWWGTERARSL